MQHLWLNTARRAHLSTLIAQRAAGQRRRGAAVTCQGVKFSSGSDGDTPDSQAGSASAAFASSQRPIPWTLTFDIRERETIWTDENKVCRHAHFHACRELALCSCMPIPAMCQPVSESGSIKAASLLHRLAWSSCLPQRSSAWTRTCCHIAFASSRCSCQT